MTTNPYIQDFAAILVNHRSAALPRYTGVTCQLRFCGHNYERDVDSGTFSETITARTWAGSSIDQDELAFQYLLDNITVPADPCPAASNNPSNTNSNTNSTSSSRANLDGDSGTNCVPASPLLSLTNTLSPLLAAAGSDNVGDRPFLETRFCGRLLGPVHRSDWGSEEAASFETVDRVFASLASVLVAGLVCRGRSGWMSCMWG